MPADGGASKSDMGISGQAFFPIREPPNLRLNLPKMYRDWFASPLTSTIIEVD